MRRKLQTGVVSEYVSSLSECGVQNIDRKSCNDGILLAACMKLAVTVYATLHFDNAGEHKTAWRSTDLARLDAFCRDSGLYQGEVAKLLAVEPA